MRNGFINVGFGNMVAIDRIVSITELYSAAAKRDMTVLGSSGRLRDFTRGRSACSLIYLDDGSAVKSGLYPENIIRAVRGF